MGHSIEQKKEYFSLMSSHLSEAKKDKEEVKACIKRARESRGQRFCGSAYWLARAAWWRSVYAWDMKNALYWKDKLKALNVSGLPV